MSSIQAASPTTPSQSTPSHSPDSVSTSEKADTTNVDAASDHLLNAVKDVRQIIRLVQCGVCSRILKDPITLPCGQSLCKTCLPETHVRTNISWPATPSRLRAFECPFADCKKEHAIGDCNVDVTLRKVLAIIQVAIEQDRDVTGSSAVSTYITARDCWDVAGVSSLKEKDITPRALKGGRIVAMYTLAETGELEYGCEATYTSAGATEEQVAQIDVAVLTKLKESARVEMDCQVCYALYLDPTTTACGHTFCRNCLQRVLDHSAYCPVCRRGLTLPSPLSTEAFPSNQRLCKIIDGFWADIVALREQTLREEALVNLASDFEIPLFVCTLSFPTMPTFLHIFEARYRLLVRRAIEGNRTFGMVITSRPRHEGDPHFRLIGTLLRIVNLEFFQDGRSLVETVGVSRFRVTSHGSLDGYALGRIEKYDDIPLAEEEALEVSETMAAQGIQDFTRPSAGAVHDPSAGNHAPAYLGGRVTLDDIETMATRDLVEVGIDFIERMRDQSVQWLAGRVFGVYGEPPRDPERFPWWLAAILPVSDDEKYRLLSTTSVRGRMKICCRWIVEWEARSW